MRVAFGVAAAAAAAAACVQAAMAKMPLYPACEASNVVVDQPNRRCSSVGAEAGDGVFTMPTRVGQCCSAMVSGPELFEATVTMRGRRRLQSAGATTRAVTLSDAFCENPEQCSLTGNEKLLMVLDMSEDLESNTCCTKCYCRGDPVCGTSNADGEEVKDEWIVCDARRRRGAKMCKARRSKCKNTVDHLGNACVWKKDRPDGRPWTSLSDSGSKCQPDWGRVGSNFPRMVMHNSADIKVELELEERGIIRQLIITGKSGNWAAALDARECFKHSPRLSDNSGASGADPVSARAVGAADFELGAWALSSQGILSNEMTLEVSLPNEGEVKWQITTSAGVYLDVHCSSSERPADVTSKTSADDAVPTMPRLDVQNLVDTQLSGDEDGFCKSGIINKNEVRDAGGPLPEPRLASKPSFHDKCLDKNLEEMNFCLQLAGSDCNKQNYEQKIAEWCNACELSRTAACQAELSRLSGRSGEEIAEAWTSKLAAMNAATISPADTRQELGEFGLISYLSKGRRGSLDTCLSAENCVTVDQYTTEPDLCRRGVSVEYLSPAGVWEQSFFIPHTLAPCNGRLEVNAFEHPELFKYQVRFADHSGSDGCLVRTGCSSSVAFSISASFRSDAGRPAEDECQVVINSNGVWTSYVSWGEDPQFHAMSDDQSLIAVQISAEPSTAGGQAQFRPITNGRKGHGPGDTLLCTTDLLTGPASTKTYLVSVGKNVDGTDTFTAVIWRVEEQLVALVSEQIVDGLATVDSVSCGVGSLFVSGLDDDGNQITKYLAVSTGATSERRRRLVDSSSSVVEAVPCGSLDGSFVQVFDVVDGDSINTVVTTFENTGSSSHNVLVFRTSKDLDATTNDNCAGFSDSPDDTTSGRGEVTRSERDPYASANLFDTSSLERFVATRINADGQGEGLQILQILDSGATCIYTITTSKDGDEVVFSHFAFSSIQNNGGQSVELALLYSITDDKTYVFYIEEASLMDEVVPKRCQTSLSSPETLTSKTGNLWVSVYQNDEFRLHVAGSVRATLSKSTASASVASHGPMFTGASVSADPLEGTKKQIGANPVTSAISILDAKTELIIDGELTVYRLVTPLVTHIKVAIPLTEGCTGPAAESLDAYLAAYEECAPQQGTAGSCPGSCPWGVTSIGQLLNQALAIPLPFCAGCDPHMLQAAQPTLKLDFSLAEDTRPCCRTCSAWGDPVAMAFGRTTSEKKKWVVCDARDRDCKISKAVCENTVDHKGRSCVWNGELSASSVAFAGSPCQADWEVSGLAGMNLYEVIDITGATFKVGLRVGERGVIEKLLVRYGSTVVADLDADTCFPAEPTTANLDGWTLQDVFGPARDGATLPSPTWINRARLAAGEIAVSAISTNEDNTIRKYLLEFAQGENQFIRVNATCLRVRNARGDFGGHRLNVDALLDTNVVRDPETDAAGFCATNEFGGYIPSEWESDLTDIQARPDVPQLDAAGGCVDTLPNKVALCSAITGQECTETELFDFAEEWCMESARKASECSQQVLKSNRRVDTGGWIKQFCESMPCVRNPHKCRADIENGGPADVQAVLDECQNELAATEGSVACKTNATLYGTAPINACRHGIYVETKAYASPSASWETLFFVPDNDLPCDESLTLPYAAFPSAFSGYVRFRRHDIDADLCSDADACERKRGFSVDYSFSSETACSDSTIPQ